MNELAMNLTAKRVDYGYLKVGEADLSPPPSGSRDQKLQKRLRADIRL
jgi:hypothetical protein